MGFFLDIICIGGLILLGYTLYTLYTWWRNPTDIQGPKITRRGYGHSYYPNPYDYV